MLGRQVAIVYGVAYGVVGLLGLLIHGMDPATGLLLGRFPVNGAHNVLHLVIGGAGLVAYAAGERLSVAYARWMGLALVGLGLLGRYVERPFDLLPIDGWDVWLHLLTGLVATYAGFRSRVERSAEREP